MIMKKILLVLLVLFSLSAWAQIPQPLPNTYVNDYAGKLSPQEVQKLNEKIAIIEKKSSVQFAVILVNDIEEEIDDYAREIGRQWHVGNAQNGLVYVAVINSHKQRLEVASHLEGDIPDATALEIIGITKPHFKAGNFYEGLSKLVESVGNRLDPVAKEQRALLERQQQKHANEVGNGFLTGFIVLLIVLGVCFILYYFYYLPKQRRLEKEQKERDKIRQESIGYKAFNKPKEPEQQKIPIRTLGRTNYPPTKDKSTPTRNTYIAPIIINTSSSDDSTNSSSSSSNSSDSSDYGSWGSDSSSSSDSGFSGGGSSSDW